MPRVRLLRHGLSMGGRSLARAIGCKLIRFTSGGDIDSDRTFTPKPEDTIINWGRSTNPWPASAVLWINYPDIVAVASNKLECFRRLSDHNVQTVPWTTEKTKAQEWLNDGASVCVRKLLRSSCANGMEIIDPGGTLPNAPLYTKYIKKAYEYRVHVICEPYGSFRTFDIQQKMRRSGIENNSKIRNLDNGWIYGRANVSGDERLKQTAESALAASGLDFGAIDIIWNRLLNSYFVLEINTAPGLEGTTLERYATELRKLIWR